MCGISGVLGHSTTKKSIIENILKIQTHRGPDSSAFWEGDQVILGHNRLSIIDLSEKANQPMRSDCGNFVLVFNGEIYNYIELREELRAEFDFKTSSDSEVLLKAYIKWGKSCLSRLNGMFAFAIFDQRKQTLFLARDRFGVKPLHYAIHEGQLLFASEIKSLWAAGVSKSVNTKVLGEYLKYDSYGGLAETFWSGIFKIPGGNYVETSLEELPGNGKQLPTTSWYDFVGNVSKYPLLDFNQAKTALEELLIDTVSLRFRADVPVGLNLSGGLDSSTLLAIIRKSSAHSANLEAFSFYSNDERYDELPWIKEMVQNFNVHLNPCLFDFRKVPEMIEQMCYFQDEPFGGFPTLAYSETFRKAREKGVLVLLDGVGVDEAFAGYDYYMSDSQSVIQGVKSSRNYNDLLNDEFEATIKKPAFAEPFSDSLLNKQYRDIFYTKIPRSLRFNDKVSMMHSTELREPFLDYRLLEFGFSLPREMKIQSGQGKWIVREMTKDLLGESIALAPKRPLQTPQREWIAGELKDYVHDLLEVVSTSEYVNKNKIDHAWKDYRGGAIQNSFHIWKLINLYYLLK